MLQPVGSFPELSGVCLAETAGSLAAGWSWQWPVAGTDFRDLSRHEAAEPMFREVPFWDWNWVLWYNYFPETFSVSMFNEDDKITEIRLTASYILNFVKKKKSFEILHFFFFPNCYHYWDLNHETYSFLKWYSYSWMHTLLFIDG